MGTDMEKGNSKFRELFEKIMGIRGLMIWFVVAVLILATWIISPSFMKPSHLLNIARQASGLGIVALGQTIVIICGGIDLSNGMVITLVNVIAATILNGKDDLILPVIFITLTIGVLVGAINGILTTKFKIPPFIGTLGMYSILRGIAYVYTNGAPKGSVSPFLRQLGSGYIGPIPTGVIIWLIFVVFGIILVANTPFGRYIYAIGGNKEATRLSGVKTERVIIASYIISGVLSSIAGLILLGYVGTGNLAVGYDYNMNSIASVVIGGTPITGGLGSILGTVGGSFFLAVLISILRFLGLEYRSQLIVQGLVLISAIAIYSSEKNE